jgi:hypothetical protein
MSASETITRFVQSTLGGVSPQDMAAEQPVVNRLKAGMTEIAKIEYSYNAGGTTTITVVGKE